MAGSLKGVVANLRIGSRTRWSKKVERVNTDPRGISWIEKIGGWRTDL